VDGTASRRGASRVSSIGRPGSFDGDPLTLPAVSIDAQDAVPYRTGRTIGHAGIVLRADGRRLATRLLLRGALFVAWSLGAAVIASGHL
jgi:hypothetical protein